MVHADIRVSCPHCGSTVVTAPDSAETSLDRLKGGSKSCSGCEGDFELYYY